MSTLVGKISPAVSNSKVPEASNPKVEVSVEPFNKAPIPSYKTESEGANLTLPSLDRREYVLGLFRDQVRTTWIPKCNELGFDAVAFFKEAESCGAIKCKMYTPKQLLHLDNVDRLLWKEEYHYSDVLKKIKMPLDPDHSFAEPCEGPVLFIRCPERNNGIIIVNGNHRTGAVMLKEYNPDSHPLYVLEFASIEVYKKLTGITPSDILYIGIEEKSGGRREPLARS